MITSKSLSRFSISAVLSLALAFAQQQGGGQTGGGQAPGGGAPAPGGGGQAPGGGGQPTPGQPTQPGQRPGQFPGRDDPMRSPFPDQMQRSIFLSGRVMLDDGTPPPEPVVIERMCNGVVRPEGYTDSKGRFSIELGRNQAMMMDASVSGPNDQFGSIGGTGGRMGGGGRVITERDLVGCELRANLAGFRSDNVNLSGRRSLDNPDVGTIVLRRLAKVEGFTFSGTTAFAPKDARKAYEKGLDRAKKQKWSEAEQNLNQAVTSYPKYAVAWYELGRVYEAQSKQEEAKKAFEESVKADGKFISPYLNLALMAGKAKNWPEVIQHTATALRLNPYLSPSTYFFSAVAHYNTGKLDVAEEHAREAAKMDAQHRNPKINQLLAAILEQKQDYKGAAENMRIYLKQVPNAPDATIAQQQLSEWEKKAVQ